MHTTRGNKKLSEAKLRQLVRNEHKRKRRTLSHMLIRGTTGSSRYQNTLEGIAFAKGGGLDIYQRPIASDYAWMQLMRFGASYDNLKQPLQQAYQYGGSIRQNAAGQYGPFFQSIPPGLLDQGSGVPAASPATGLVSQTSEPPTQGLDKSKAQKIAEHIAEMVQKRQEGKPRPAEQGNLRGGTADESKTYHLRGTRGIGGLPKLSQVNWLQYLNPSNYQVPTNWGVNQLFALLYDQATPENVAAAIIVLLITHGYIFYFPAIEQAAQAAGGIVPLLQNWLEEQTRPYNMFNPRATPGPLRNLDPPGTYPGPDVEAPRSPPTSLRLGADPTTPEPTGTAETVSTAEFNRLNEESPFQRLASTVYTPIRGAIRGLTQLLQTTPALPELQTEEGRMVMASLDRHLESGFVTEKFKEYIRQVRADPRISPFMQNFQAIENPVERAVPISTLTRQELYKEFLDKMTASALEHKAP